MEDQKQNLMLHSIIELKECERFEVANEYLKLGWKLISKHLNDEGNPVERHQKTIYCLGWCKELGKPNHNINRSSSYSSREGY